MCELYLAMDRNADISHVIRTYLSSSPTSVSSTVAVCSSGGLVNEMGLPCVKLEKMSTLWCWWLTMWLASILSGTLASSPGPDLTERYPKKRPSNENIKPFPHFSKLCSCSHRRDVVGLETRDKMKEKNKEWQWKREPQRNGSEL